MPNILVYGANGYTGRLTLAEATTDAIGDLVLAGRNKAALDELAHTYNARTVAFDLSDTQALHNAVQSCDLVLNLAGPYRHTAAPVRAACIENKKHYVDITGELSVFADHATYHQQATAAGIVLLSGAGYDVVPSDCLINHVAAMINDPTEVDIYFSGGSGTMTRGTMRSGLAGLFDGFPVRRDGQITLLQKPIRRDLTRDGESNTYYSAGWGDLETAWQSAGIPNISCFFQREPGFGMGGPFAPIIKPILKSGIGTKVLNKIINSLPEGPSDQDRQASRQTLIAIARNNAGDIAAAILETPESYTLTAWTCLKASHDILAGKASAGYHTPASAFGPGFVLSMPGTILTEIDPHSLHIT